MNGALGCDYSDESDWTVLSCSTILIVLCCIRWFWLKSLRMKYPRASFQLEAAELFFCKILFITMPLCLSVRRPSTSYWPVSWSSPEWISKASWVPCSTTPVDSGGTGERLCSACWIFDTGRIQIIAFSTFQNYNQLVTNETESWLFLFIHCSVCYVNPLTPTSD